MLINENKIFDRNVKHSTEILKNMTVGIAGCGGLGSNSAISLCRAGIGTLILADFDIVEESNLNRQYYFLSDIGKSKPEALKKHLQNINPDIKTIIIKEKLTKDNFLIFFRDCNGIIEAFDRAEEKQWLIDSWAKDLQDIPLICGSGMSGLGNFSTIKRVRSGNLIICGDQISCFTEGLNSARVAIVANLQAFEMIKCLLGETNDYS